jgi:hypothetical protein
MTPRGVGLAVKNVYPMEDVTSMGITVNGHRDFSGICMKIRLEGASSFGYLKCPEDGNELLVFHEDDVTLQSCEHYRWHAGPNSDDESNVNENDKDEEGEDWNEILRDNHIAAIEVEGAKFYLIHLEKAKPT